MSNFKRRASDQWQPEIVRLRHAVNLAATCVPEMELTPLDPVSMMHRVCDEFSLLQQENIRLHRELEVRETL